MVTQRSKNCPISSARTCSAQMLKQLPKNFVRIAFGLPVYWNSLKQWKFIFQIAHWNDQKKTYEMGESDSFQSSSKKTSKSTKHIIITSILVSETDFCSIWTKQTSWFERSNCPKVHIKRSIQFVAYLNLIVIICMLICRTQFPPVLGILFVLREVVFDTAYWQLISGHNSHQVTIDIKYNKTELISTKVKLNKNKN